MSLSDKVYIHYGDNEFDISKFNSIKNRGIGILPKPYGGLWASPLNPKNIGWYDWCIDNDFSKKKKDSYLSSHFTFELYKGSKIFKISSMRDINKLRELITCEYTLYGYDEYYYDFEKLQEMDYDGIELELNSYDIYMAMYGWDVDSLLVFNPDIIYPLTNG